MIFYRHFINTDPPLIVDVWNQQQSMAGQIQKITTLICEKHLLSKPYFDPAGLILAFRRIEQNLQVVGFVHAGFSRNSTGSDIDRTQGVVSTLKVLDAPDSSEIAGQLLRKACEYLMSGGATSIHAGSCFPYAPFYRGLYGGSEVPGVLEHDKNFITACQSNNFVQQDRIAVWQRSLKTFRPVGGRDQLAIRRKYKINTVPDATPQTWWANCALGMSQRERMSIFNKVSQTVCGDVSLWDMHPLYEGVALARGIYGLNVSEELRRSGIATFLLGEALKYSMQSGIELVEAQTRESESAAGGVFQKLGFELKYRGLLLTRST